MHNPILFPSDVASESEQELVVPKTMIIKNESLKTITKYKTGKKLGEGASSVVYAAKTSKKHKRVALKFFKTKFYAKHVSLVEEEAKIIRSFKHPNIVKLLDTSVQNNVPVFVFERCKASLGVTLDERPFVLLSTYKSIIRQILGALVAIHAAGYVHRDVKVENILVDYAGCVKLADFGFAVTVDKALKGASNVAGTRYYMPPEAFVAPRAYNETFDIWSVGILTFKLLAQVDHYEMHGRTKYGSEQKMIQLYAKGTLDMKPYKKDLGREEFEFISAALTVDFLKRPSAAECLKLAFCRTPPKKRKHRRFLSVSKS
mmetsp:Transcript_29418/g.32714  ORF Transcript_29418/g.32714 Transcript_29418/m.32714 type:complete len:316 (-) Transcript_29418:174-1121(-)